MTPREERWLPVPGWDGVYEVSDAGRVRSVDRVLSDGRTAGGLLLTPGLRKGYLVVTLSRGKQRSTVAVHRLVMLAFRPGGARRWPQVRHRNGDQTDCRLSNLRWGDQALNERDKITKERKLRAGRGIGRQRRDRKTREIGGKERSNRERNRNGKEVDRNIVSGGTSRVENPGTAGTPPSTAASRAVPGLTNRGPGVSPAHVPGTQGDLRHGNGHRESP